MTHARACTCCGDGSGGFGCDNPPPCLQITLSGVSALGSCQGIQIIAIGHNFTTIVNATGFPGSYQGTVPAILIVTFPDGFPTFISTTIVVTVRISCHTRRGVDEFRIEIIAAGWDPGLFGIGTTVFAYAHFNTDILIGDSAPSSRVSSCPPANTIDIFGGGSAVVTIPANCEPIDPVFVGHHCDGLLPDIGVDISSIPEGFEGRTVLLGDERYFIGERTQLPADQIVWSSDPCFVSSETRIARRCFGTETIAYSLDAAPAGAQTCIYQGFQYELTNEPTTDLAVNVLFLANQCGVVDCSSISGPNDPRCQLIEYRHCPECGPQDGGDPGGSDGFLTSDDDPNRGLGDLVKQAIELLTLHRIKECSRCERRRVILNHFGQRHGRWIIHKMKI